MNYYLLLLIGLILIAIIYYIKTTKENFGGVVIENIKSGTRSFDDKLFDDVTMYKSNPKDVSQMGLYTCLEKCKGNCVEYGMTGDAFCFPEKT